MLNKKKTLVIDSEAEEKAKAQAIKQELDSLKPKQQPKPQEDLSKETNHKALSKIHSRSIKFAIFACIALFVILGLAWSINQKIKNDREKAETAAKTQKERELSNKANDLIVGGSEADQEACKYDGDTADQDCIDQKTLTQIDSLMNESASDMAESDRDSLLSKKLQITIDGGGALGSDQKIAALDQVFADAKKYNVGYRVYGEIGEYYMALGNDDKAIEAFKIAKAKHAEKISSNPSYDLDLHSFPVTKEEIEAMRR